MTTKKTATTAKKTTAKAATEKKTATTAKKATTTKKTASKGAVAVAEPVAETTVTEKLVATMMPETPKTEITMEAVVAAAEAKAEVTSAPAAPKQIVLTIGMFQKRLSELGLYDGPWDGVYGPSTKHAAARFQAGKGLKVNGDANPETLAALGLDLYKTY